MCIETLKNVERIMRNSHTKSKIKIFYTLGLVR